MSIEQDYRALLLDISREITQRELEEMKFLCVDRIPESRQEGAKTLDFFRELEKQTVLRSDNLELLVYMLERVKRPDLVFRLRSFQLFQRAYFEQLDGRNAGGTTYHQETAQRNNNNCIVNNSEFPSSNDCRSQSSEDQSSCKAEQTAEIAVRCVVKLASVGAWLAGSAYILNKYREDPDALVNLITKAVLPSGIAIRYIVGGSVKLVLWATDLCALKELWNRYNSNQLRKDLEKVLVTEDLVKLAEGETIEFSVEMDENEYRHAYLDLVVAYNKAQRKVAANRFSAKPRRSSSLPDMTSVCIQSPSVQSQAQKCASPKVSLVAHPWKPTHLGEWRSSSSASSGQFSSSSVCSESGDDRHVYLNDFLQNIEKVQDICAILDREMILCHDWRSLASEFGYKMKDICLLEIKKSPSMALLQDITHKSPDARLSELIDKLSYLERDDVVDQILGSTDNNIPESLVNLPFIVRKKIALELDHATIAQFTEVVHKLASSVSSAEIMALQKRSSPTMALLEELETAYPSLHISHLQEACKGHVGGVEVILKEYTKTLKHRKLKLSTKAKRMESLKKLERVGGDSGVSLGAPMSP